MEYGDQKMNDFTSVYPEAKVLDPSKRVNYIHGLVLGVDEFKQEECYLLEKDRLHNRSLHGYGTVCGLAITQEEIDASFEIKVEPGMAISPIGQVIQVPRTQCAKLDEWLASHSEEISAYLGSPTAGSVSLYLMLCYSECETDLVPIPTGPCQSLEETSAASRIADSFSLSFELEAPADEHFDPAMQDLTNLLLNIPVDPAGTMTIDEVRDLVRTLIPLGSPADSPAISSPVISGAIAPENLEEFFHAAFLVWVTEVKPCLLTDTTQCIPTDLYKNCVFLAQVNFDVETIDGIVRLDTNVDVEIDQSSRQFLINTQGLQNYMGPLSYWVKSLENIALPEEIIPPGEELLENVVMLSGSQTITGSKTFNAPIRLTGNGRVLKNIILPAHLAHHGRGAASGLFSDSLPAMHFMTTGSNAFTGEALFNIPIPEDIVYPRGFQFRLIWGFQGNPEPSGINFTWQVGAQFFQINDPVSATPFQFVPLPVSEVTARRNDVLVTDFTDFDETIHFNSDSSYGAIHISIDDPGVPIPQVHLLQLELQYVANRLGGRI